MSWVVPCLVILALIGIPSAIAFNLGRWYERVKNER
jgi:hypothetical protein